MPGISSDRLGDGASGMFEFGAPGGGEAPAGPPPDQVPAIVNLTGAPNNVGDQFEVTFPFRDAFSSVATLTYSGVEVTGGDPDVDGVNAGPGYYILLYTPSVPGTLRLFGNFLDGEGAPFDAFDISVVVT